MVAAAVSVVVMAVPLAYLLVRVLGAGWTSIIETLLRPRTLETAATSITLVVLVVGLALVIAIPTAVLIARTDIPGVRFWWVVTALPLAIPSYVAAYTWIAEFPAMSGIWAATLVMALCTFPYISIPLAISLRRIDVSYEDVARNLGSNPLRTLMRVTLPIVWPAGAAGALLVGLYTLAEFGTVAIFRVDAFTRVIYASYRASFDRVSAAVLAILLVVLALILVWIEARVRGRARRWRVGGGSARPASPLHLSGWRRTLALAWLSAVLLLSLGVPAASLLRQLAISRNAVWNPSEMAGALLGSITASGAGALLALLLALPVAALAARYATRGVRWLETSAFLGQALPGVVVGLSLVFLTLALVPSVYQTIITVAVAYAILFTPKAIGSARSAMAAVPPGMEQVARSLGRGPLRAWWDVTGRLAWPGIAAGVLLVLLTAMKELPATLMLRPTGFNTLATELWTRTEVGSFGAAAPYALALVALAAVPAWLLSRWMGAPASTSTVQEDALVEVRV